MKRIILSALLALVLAFNGGQALAGSFATGEVIIDWSSLAFSTPLAFDYQESFVETGLNGVYADDFAAGFTNVELTGFDGNADAFAATYDPFGEAALAIAGPGDFDAYAYSEVYGTFTPAQDMTVTVSFDYELFAEAEAIGGGSALGEAYIDMLLGDESFFDLLTFSVAGNGYESDIVAGTASLTATLLAGISYDFRIASDAVATTAVPVPAAIWLLGAGLAGALGLRKRNA